MVSYKRHCPKLRCTLLGALHSAQWGIVEARAIRGVGVAGGIGSFTPMSVGIGVFCPIYHWHTHGAVSKIHGHAKLLDGVNPVATI